MTATSSNNQGNKKTYYEVMGLAENATPEEIRKAYRKLARQYHPDSGKTPDAVKMMEIGEAYGRLKNEELRHDYNRSLAKDRSNRFQAGSHRGAAASNHSSGRPQNSGTGQADRTTAGRHVKDPPRHTNHHKPGFFKRNRIKIAAALVVAAVAAVGIMAMSSDKDDIKAPGIDNGLNCGERALKTFTTADGFKETFSVYGMNAVVPECASMVKHGLLHPVQTFKRFQMQSGNKGTPGTSGTGTRAQRMWNAYEQKLGHAQNLDRLQSKMDIGSEQTNNLFKNLKRFGPDIAKTAYDLEEKSYKVSLSDDPQEIGGEFAKVTSTGLMLMFQKCTTPSEGQTPSCSEPYAFAAWDHVIKHQYSNFAQEAAKKTLTRRAYVRKKTTGSIATLR